MSGGGGANLTTGGPFDPPLITLFYALIQAGQKIKKYISLFLQQLEQFIPKPLKIVLLSGGPMRLEWGAQPGDWGAI